MAELLQTRRASVALLTLDRPQKRNALSIELRLELAAVFGALADDDEVACVVLTGAGSAFCAGMDRNQFGGDHANRQRLVESSAAAFGALGRFPKPVVAAVNGPAVAGGFALALMCDVRVASTQARFGFPELPIGIPPAYAAARSVLDGGLARELCLTGRILDSQEALARGVVSAVHDPDELVEQSLALGAQIASMPAGAPAETKRRILLERDTSWGALFEREEQAFHEALLGGGAPAGAS